MENKWYNVVLSYLTNEQTYLVVMAMLKAFGVKISPSLQSAITKLGVAIGELGLAIENLVNTIELEKNDNTAKEE